MKQTRPNWQQTAHAALANRLAPCTNCGGSEVAFTSIINPPVVAHAAPTTPSAFHLVVTCSGCSMIRLFDAEALGLIATS